MSKPTTNEIYEFLNKVSGLVVHFSGCPKGIGRENNLYPDDLNKIINDHVHGGLSCSLIIPGDNFSADKVTNEAIGAIGVIVGFDEDGLVAVSPSDCGSYAGDDDVRQAFEKDIKIEDLRSSLTERQNYNEWFIKQNKILGIFVFDINNISVIANNNIDGAEYSIAVYIKFDDVKNTFKNMEIYTFSNGGIARLDRNTGEFIKITQGDLYR